MCRGVEAGTVAAASGRAMPATAAAGDTERPVLVCGHLVMVLGGAPRRWRGGLGGHGANASHPARFRLQS